MIVSYHLLERVPVHCMLSHMLFRCKLREEVVQFHVGEDAREDVLVLVFGHVE